MERFELEFELPLNLFNWGPLVCWLGLPLATLLVVSATRWSSYSFYAALVMLFLSIGLVKLLFSHQRGRASISIGADVMVLEETTGPSREIPLEKVRKVEPKRRDSIYQDEEDVGMLMVWTADGVERLPKNRALVLPYRGTEKLARQIRDHLAQDQSTVDS